MEADRAGMPFCFDDICACFQKQAEIGNSACDDEMIIT
jgi:hypothetical protein